MQTADQHSSRSSVIRYSVKTYYLPPTLVLILVVLSLSYIPYDKDASGGQVVARIHHLAKYSSHPDHLARPYLSAAGAGVRREIMSYMKEAGMWTRVDGVGNVIGGLDCGESGRRNVVLLGGHFDVVEDGGMWDGVYGVLAAVAAVKSLGCKRLRGLRVEVVGFDDEEGGGGWDGAMAGSKGYAGVWGTGEVQRMVSEKFTRAYEASIGSVSGSGIERREAVMRAVEGAKREEGFREVVGFLEVHIEQGPVLEEKGIGIGVVSGIFGQTSLKVTVVGEKGHAGTVPMSMRRDALAGAAELVLRVEKEGRRMQGRGVATVGRLETRPGIGNTISGEVELTVDIRAESDRMRREMIEKVGRITKEIASRRGLIISMKKVHDMDAVLMNGTISESAKAAVRNVIADGEVVSLMSGAGHDAAILAQSGIDVGMLFLRCRGGVSHDRNEFVSDDDVKLGIRTVREFLLDVAGRQAEGNFEQY